MTERKEILEKVEPLIDELILNARGKKRIYDKELARLRINYAQALASVLRAYNSILKESELEEVLNRLDELEKQFNKEE